MTNQNLDIADFHSHTLPCADHGSDSVETSVFQLNLAKKYGITRILSTPHFYPHLHTVEDFIALRQNAYNQLLAKTAEDAPKLKLGAEVLLCPGIDKLDGLRSLCLCGSEYILIELPFSDLYDEHFTTFDNLKKAGYKVILAHADRYPYQNIDNLLNLGVEMLQLNVSSLLTVFKGKRLLEWIDSNAVVALGSDIHGRDLKAYKNFKNVKSKLINKLANIKAVSDKIWNEIASYS